MSQRTYAPENHIIGHKGSLWHAATAAGPFIRIIGTQEVNLPERELSEAEHTSDDSPDYTREFMPGMFDPGSVTATYVYQPDQFGDMETLYQLASDVNTRDDATRVWKSIQPDGTCATFAAWVKKHDMPRDQEGTMICTLELRATGVMDFASSSGINEEDGSIDEGGGEP